MGKTLVILWIQKFTLSIYNLRKFQGGPSSLIMKTKMQDMEVQIQLSAWWQEDDQIS